MLVKWWWCLKSNILFKKKTENSVITSETNYCKALKLDTNYYEVQDWKIFVHVSIIKHKHPLEGHTLNIVHQILCGSTLKRNELKVYISLKESKLTCFTNSWGSFQVHDLVRAENVWRGTCFFTVVVHACTKSQKSQQTRHTKKIVCQNFQFFQHLKITFMCTCRFYNRYEHV